MKEKPIIVLFLVFFDVNSRLQVPEKYIHMGNMYDVKDLTYYLEELKLNFDSDIEGALERYLLEKREELRNSEDNICEEIYKIFSDIENDLKLIFDDETTVLSFDDFNNRVLIIQKMKISLLDLMSYLLVLNQFLKYTLIF